jgi:arylformamidase
MNNATTQSSPRIWLDLDQAMLDAAYDQSLNAANFRTVGERMTRSSLVTRDRLGEPQVYQYGPDRGQTLHFYAASIPNAPIHIHVHGGAWRQKSALDLVFPAEHFLAHNISYGIFDFTSVDETKGDLRPMLEDVCRCLSWVARNTQELGGANDSLYVSGFSSGAHLASVALLCDWQAYGLPSNPYKAALLISGIYDLHPVRLSSRSTYVSFTDEVEDGLSPQRHVERYNLPLMLAYGDGESPEFQRQARDFAKALDAAGKPCSLLAYNGYNHLEMMEALGNSFSLIGRSAIEQVHRK